MQEPSENIKKEPTEWVESRETGYPSISSPVFTTPQGTYYLQAPGVALLSKPAVNIAGLGAFLEGFDGKLQFPQYLNDTTPLPSGTQLCKVAGQLCYASFTPKRTKNENAQRYFQNIKDSGHGSVLEHANYSLLFYGISRSVTHELVRHRAGMAYSQLSQRYVSGTVLRFVERPEYQDDLELHTLFERRIDTAAHDYETIAEGLVARQKLGSTILSGEVRTDLRKKVQQTARSVLPNETEAPIVVTGNARALRHFIEMRANPHAETEIRALAFRTYLCLVAIEPILFEDYRIVRVSDGTYAVETDYPKV
ncbi:MAG: FAD-dependent thymidylate synthase [Armatimonadetes bacterium]|nr:FAD-dependent thymidylate synthase [Armatimonadota bacterium]